MRRRPVNRLVLAVGVGLALLIIAVIVGLLLTRGGQIAPPWQSGAGSGDNGGTGAGGGSGSGSGSGTSSGGGSGSGWVSRSGSGASSAGGANSGVASPADAVGLLGQLPIKGKAPYTGYSRTLQFGEAWDDTDHNGCNTRDDILARDLSGVSRSSTCKVLKGVLLDPYTGATVSFVRGISTSPDVQIDHVVALLDAWETGAQQLTFAQRLAFANDPRNLLAVGGEINQAKGSGDAATWLPPNRAYRCEYVARQITVKAAYGLWITSAEHEAMARVLSSCGG
jgi:hypothetical protein